MFDVGFVADCGIWPGQISRWQRFFGLRARFAAWFYEYNNIGYTGYFFLFTPSIGSTQRLPNGNTLIDFGNLQLLQLGSILVEVTPDNEVVFQLEYENGGNLYRAHKFDWFFYDPEIESIGETQPQKKELVMVLNLLGQEVEHNPNTLQLHLFTDGSVEKRFAIN